MKSVEDSFWNNTDVKMIQDISDEEIAEMQHIQPLIERVGLLWRIRGIDDIDPRRTSFLWDAEPAGVGLIPGALNSVQIMTFHKYGAPSFFKPSLAEVYSAIRRFIPQWKEAKFFHLQDDNLSVSNIMGDYHFVRCSVFGDDFREVKEG